MKINIKTMIRNNIKQENGISSCKAIITLMNGCLGTTILYIPHIFFLINNIYVCLILLIVFYIF